ncbi:MAG: hypothetical protein HY880_04555, partial [Deltaproteobacteria bacterium]|nr:hypothetical protein [Deltaproteobacteria bacterium]
EVSAEMIRGAVWRFLSDPRMWKQMSDNGPLLIDGRGAERIADIITGLLEQRCITADT